MITLRTWILIALTVLAGAGAIALWHWQSPQPCVDDSIIYAPSTTVRATFANAAAQTPLLRAQDDTGSDDASLDSDQQQDEDACQSALMKANSERAAAGLLFLVLLSCSVLSLLKDRRAMRRRRWSKRVTHR